MIIGVNRRLATALAGQRLVRATGDHLVHVHVGLGARSGLPDDERELIVELARDDLGRCRLDRIGNLPIQPVQPIHPRRRLFHDRQRMRDRDRHAFALAEGEILDRSLGLGTPISRSRDLDRTEAVGFGARVGHVGSPTCESIAT